MRAEDLTPLLAPGDSARGAMSYAQGTVTSWDPNTGRNSVSVAGTTLQDLPILNTGEAITLKVGHVVGLTRWQSQWFILGRITIAGSGQFGAASVAFDSERGRADAFAVPGGTDNQPVVRSGQITVPAWADEALVMVTGSVNVNNTKADTSWANYYANAGITDDTGASWWNNSGLMSAPKDHYSTQSVQCNRILDVTTTKHLIGYLGMGSGPWAAHDRNFAQVDIVTLFRATV